MDFGILSRKYRVGYYGPNNENLQNNIKNLVAFEYPNKEQAPKEVQIDLIDLSDPSKFDEFNYQCDIIIFDANTLNSDIESEKNTAQETLKNLIATNEAKYDENGRKIHDSARFISIYHKENFSSDINIKEFLMNYKQNFKNFLSAPCLDITEESLISDLIPDSIADHIELTKLMLELEKGGDPTRIITRFAAKVCITFDIKNPYTKGHSERVGLLTKQLTESMKFTKEEFLKKYPNIDFDKNCVPDSTDPNLYKFSSEYTNLVAAIGMAHDIGKIAIPNHIIDKTSRLTDTEFEIMKNHTRIRSNACRRISNNIS